MEHMKRLILIFYATFMFAPMLSAQDNNESENVNKTENTQDYQVGAQGSSSFGFNLMYNFPSQDADSAYGLIGELLFGKYVARNLNFEGGLGVYWGGFQDSYIDLSSTALGIPINLAYRIPFTQSGMTGLRLYTGPKLKLLVGANGESFGEKITFSDLKKQDGFKSFSAYWTFGLSFEIHVISISAEYKCLLGKKSEYASGAFGLGLSVRL